MADGESNLGIPEGYIPWLFESEEKDEEGNPIKNSLLMRTVRLSSVMSAPV